jgi:type II secretory pathway component PulF
MPVFTYTAVDPAGTQTAGRLTADGRAAALRQVAAQGLQPVWVEEEREAAPAGGAARSWSRHVSQAAVEAFTRELANLLAAGVSLSRALHILSRQASSGAARRQWSAIRDDVVGGAPLADALARWPRTFPPVYVAMVRAGETGGFLDVVLEQIADFRARERDLKGRVKAALVYPIVLAVLAVAVLIFLLSYFIPRFSGIFAEFGAALPALTRAIVAASGLVTDYGLVLVLVAALVVLGLRRIVASEAGRRSVERVLLRLPGVGTVVARFALVRFCRMLGALVGAGVPLVSALRVAREAIGNQILADAVAYAVDQVQRGAPLAPSLAFAGRLFPPSVIEMVAVAEESSRLDKELGRLAATYEADLDRRLRMLVALAEPGLLFVMAGVIGTVVIGMLLPVFTLQELIR